MTTVAQNLRIERGTSEPWPTYCMSTNSVGQQWAIHITQITPLGGRGRYRPGPRAQPPISSLSFSFSFSFFSYAVRWKSPSTTAWLQSSGCDFCQFTPQEPRAKCHKFRGRDWRLSICSRVQNSLSVFLSQKSSSTLPLRALSRNSWTIEQSLLTHSIISYCVWILGIVFITKR